MSFSKIIILGAGAIGSLYGAFLSKRNDVTLIGNRAHVEAVNSKGLMISGESDKTLRLKADTEIRKITERTLIILTTKAYDSTTSIARMKRLLKKDTLILVLQNGLGNEERVKHASEGKAKVLRGITTMAAEFFEPGEIRFWKGETIVEQNEDGKKIMEVFSECGLKTRLSSNIEKEIWDKLIVNCVVNPLSALLRVRNCEIVTDSLKTVRYEIVRECVEVGRAEGMGFPQDFWTEIDHKISKYTNFSSMYQDVIKGKKTEIDFLNGKIVELGRKHHILTPVNKTLTSLTKFMEEKNGFSKED